MKNLTPFEREYLNVLRERKRKGLPLKRPNPSAKTRLWPSSKAQDYNKWLEIVFSFPVKALVSKAKEKAKTLLMDSLDNGVHMDVEEDATVWALFGAELQEYQNSLMLPQTSTMAAAIFGFAESVYEFEKGQWQKYAMMTIGRAWEEEDVWAQEALKEWQNTQLTLIKSVADKQVAMVGAIVKEGVRNGLHSSVIAATLERDLLGLSRAKAKIIARDQVGKLYGTLTEFQDTNAGIEEYDWRTSTDERVRGNPTGKYKNAIPSHWIMHGKTCLWSNPRVWWNGDAFVERDPKAPVVHPGKEILCRCVSIPRVDILFDRLLAQL